MDNITPFEQRIITLTVMLVAVIEVLDTTIVNVVLPPMMGSLSASSDEITWVLTSYIVSAAVMMPLTGYLSAKFGQRRLLLINIAGFMVASALCGLSSSLQQMVFFRILQGVFGASLVPLSQVILRRSYQEKDYGKAMAIWGIGLMVAPVLGPTLGGFISEHLNWRWIFFINLPVCISAFLMTLSFVKESEKEARKTDWLGLFLMCLSISALQIFLDKGNSLDWFANGNIRFLFTASLCFGSLFILRGTHISHNIVNLYLFKDRVFAFSTLLVALFMGTMMGLIVLQPLMLESIMGYNPEQTGMLLAPRGLSSALSMAIAARLLGKGVHPKFLISLGLIIAGLGSSFMTQYSIATTAQTFCLVGALQGFGIGFFFVPLSAVAFQNLTKSETAEAAGLFAFGRSLGSSIGISVFSSLYAQQKQINFGLLGDKVYQGAQGLSHWMEHLSAPLSKKQALSAITQKLHHIAMMNAFDNTFLVSAALFFFLAPFVFLLKLKRLAK